MITIDALKQWGANTQEGLQRCMNNEALYLRLINMFFDKNSFDELKEAVTNDDLDKAFQAAHALKGVLGNLSLKPLFDIVFEITELLRNRTKMDYSEYLQKYENKYFELLALR